MRRTLWWALGATVALAAIALWVPERSPALIAAIEPRIRDHEKSIAAVLPSSQSEQRSTTSLPASLPDYEIEPATRDFIAAQPPAPTSKTMQVAALPPSLLPVTALPTTTPQPPAMNVRYMGRMTAPDGRRLVYLARDNSPLLVAPGDRLDEGYMVESIAADSITLVYPPLGTKLVVPIPSADMP